MVFYRGGQVTDQARTAADNAINQNISFADLQKVADELKSLGTEIVTSYQTQTTSVQDQINSIVTGGAGNPASGGTTVMTGPDGKQWTVPNDKVSLFKQNGYK